MSWNNGKRRADEAWAVTDQEGKIAWTIGSNKTDPKFMVYGDKATACSKLHRAPKVEGRIYYTNL